jgi:sugar phosphate isomerase/epimerase
MFDAWSPFLHGADLRAAALKMAKITVHTTLADYQLRPRYKYHPAVVNYTAETPLVQAVPMGQGAIDYRAFLSAMQEAGFEGSIAYEMCSPLLTGGSLVALDSCARTFLEYIKSS